MRILDSLLSLLTADSCITCNKSGDILCAACRHQSLSDVPDRCYICMRMTRDGALCVSHKPQSRLRYVHVRTIYDTIPKQLILDYKFKHKRRYAAVLAKSICEKLPYYDKEYVVTYIPTVPSHVRERGFDHAESLARALAHELKLPFTRLLTRQGTSRQVGASRSQRIKQQIDSFRAINTFITADARVLLVDDIITTGGTIESAAAVLKSTGAKSIDAIVFAQAVG